MTSRDAARDAVRAAGGPDLLERLDHLDAHQAERRDLRSATPVRSSRAPDARASIDVDVLLAGGGLWSLLAPVLAARGLRVAVADRARVAQSHREWNASRPELEALVRTGLASHEEVERLIVSRYERGICRFRGGGTYAVRGVLDCAVDAGGLLTLGREKAAALGVRLLDSHAVVGESVGPSGVTARLQSSSGQSELTARVLVDARGASSPHATADLVCPTVGGVVAGLAVGDGPQELDPATGEILVTIDDAEDGRQHVWEAFPGRTGEATVYLFHYAPADEPVRLADLYGRFFATLPVYKRGSPTLVRPTFGFIPGWSRLRAAPRSPGPRVLLVGDAAARHSPLTCCGFGATLRSLEGAAAQVVRAAEGSKPPSCIVDDAKLHGVTGALAQVMASRALSGRAMNELLDAAFRSLADLGEERYAALLRDELSPRDAVRFLRHTAARHPAVWRQIISALGPWPATRWAMQVAWRAAT